MASPSVRIMCAADAAFFPFIPTMLNSVLQNTTALLEVGILVRAVAESEKRELVRLFPSVTIHYFDVELGALGNLYVKMALSPMSYARVLMADRVDWDKFVYLDIDMLVMGDVRELFETDLADKPFAACFPDGRLNAGMMVINAAHWRERDLASQILQFARTHRPKEADQASIEAVCGSEGVPLDVRWNVLVDPMWGRRLFRDPDRFRQAKILHFITGFKPWNFGFFLLPAELRQSWRRHFKPSCLRRDPMAELRFASWQAKTLMLEASKYCAARAVRIARSAVDHT